MRTLAVSFPRLLLQAVDLLLIEPVNESLMLGFRIEWNPGKTELFVTFGGKGAADAKRQLY